MRRFGAFICSFLCVGISGAKLSAQTPLEKLRVTYSAIGGSQASVWIPYEAGIFRKHAKAATLYTTIPVALETGNFDLRTRSKVFRINTDGDERVKGVSYFDAEGQARELHAGEERAEGYRLKRSSR